jgi:chitin disaccharide deacetylase
MKKTQLIINADDFGASEEVNEAIVRGFRHGVLTSCSLMVSGKAFDQAVSLAKENELLAVGIHLVTVLGKSVLPHCDIPNLVDENGNFASDPTAAGVRYYFSCKARRELTRELHAQFEKFCSTGLKLSHIDSHLHMHVHPVIFRIAVELGNRFGVTRMRVPEDELKLSVSFSQKPRHSLLTQSLVFRLLTRLMKKRLKANGFRFADRVYGNFMSGEMSEEFVLSVMDQLKVEANEIYLHPAFHIDAGQLDPLQLQAFEEFQILVSRKVIERAKAPDIELTSYEGLH